MPAKAVLTYLQTQLAGEYDGVHNTLIDLQLMPAPRRLALQDVTTRLYLWPERILESRFTESAGAGFRHLTYSPLGLTLRQTFSAGASNWLPFLGLLESLQAFLRTLGSPANVPIVDPDTGEGSYLVKLHERATTDFAYVEVLRQDNPITTQAHLAVEALEQIQGPGVV